MTKRLRRILIMIDFHSEIDFELENRSNYSDWVSRVIKSEEFEIGKLDYIFCDDSRLLSINQEYLGHNTYTDIITFDYTDKGVLSGDIFISIDRVKDNADEFQVSFENELLRVMSHGILHLAGFGDKTEKEANKMRLKEEEKIKMFHVEQ